MREKFYKYTPSFRAINLFLTVAWGVMLPIAIVTGLWKSVAFISVVSIYANFVSHLAAWRADVPIPNPTEHKIVEGVEEIKEQVKPDCGQDTVYTKSS